MNLNLNEDWESFRILWKHKRLYFFCALLPLILDIIGNVFRDTALLSQTCTLLKWFIALPLFAIAWAKYLLDSISCKPSIKSYFKIDGKVGRYMICSLLIFSLCLAWEYLVSWVYSMGGGGWPLILGYLILHYYYLSVPLIISFWTAFYFSLTSILILPSVADHNSMTVVNIFKKSAPYRKGFSWEIIAWLFLLLYVPNKAQSLGMDLIGYGSGFSRVPSGLFTIFLYILKSFLDYAFIGLILNFTTLFYMKYLKDKKSME